MSMTTPRVPAGGARTLAHGWSHRAWAEEKRSNTSPSQEYLELLELRPERPETPVQPHAKTVYFFKMVVGSVATTTRHERRARSRRERERERRKKERRKKRKGRKEERKEGRKKKERCEGGEGHVVKRSQTMPMSSRAMPLPTGVNWPSHQIASTGQHVIDMHMSRERHTTCVE